MEHQTPLTSGRLIGFAITTNPARTIHFYQQTLGFRFVSQDQFAVVFDCNGSMLRLAILPEFQPPQYTVVGWQVDDIEPVVDYLAKAGVEMMKYSFLPQAPSGVWTTPNGNKVAWFKDPDGNLLSVSQHNS